MIDIKKKFDFRNTYFFLKIRIFLFGLKNGKINLRKFYNFLVCNISYIFKRKKSGNSPIIISIDLWNECNENCVFCRDKDGNIFDLNPKSEKFIPKIKLDIIHYKNVVDAFHKDLMMIIPYVNGEPLMYKGIYEAIDYATKKKLLSLIASNGILLNENNSKKLIDAGLDFLKVHISGFTNSVHQIQHRKGDVELILKNLNNFIKLRENNKSGVLVMLDYILYNHNSHEVKLAEKFAKDNKIIFNIRPGNPKGMEETESKQRDVHFDKKTPCDWPWKAMTLNNNRDLCPCCEYSVMSDPGPYGKINENSDLYKIWTGEDVKKFRLNHITSGRSEIDICKNCDRQGIGFKF